MKTLREIKDAIMRSSDTEPLHDELLALLEIVAALDARLDMTDPILLAHKHQLDRHETALNRLVRLDAASPIDKIEALIAGLRAENERLKREAIVRVDAASAHIEASTVVAIATWLERRATEILAPNRHCIEAQHRAAGLTDAIDALRAGTWKEQG